jgi:hypothetical protein
MKLAASMGFGGRFVPETIDAVLALNGDAAQGEPR